MDAYNNPEGRKREIKRILSTIGLNPATQVHSTAETIFQGMLKESTGGQTVVTMKAPAIATEYVKSDSVTKAKAKSSGALFEIEIPTDVDVESRLAKRHGEKLTFGYTNTAATVAYPGGYGERTANALSKEDVTYQVKGTFPSATVALAKLKARVEARGGNTEALDNVFAKLWGLKEEEAQALPRYHVAGSEPTRMAAMEDRAYHSLAGHPSINGGYRVDMATIAPDAFGKDVPINWQRLRTGMKAVALTTLQGDHWVYERLRKREESACLRFTMNIVTTSQPVYRRPDPWENVLDAVIRTPVNSGYVPQSTVTDVGGVLQMGMIESSNSQRIIEAAPRINARVHRIANLVSDVTSRAVTRTLEVIATYASDRALAEEELEDEINQQSQAYLSRQFIVPENKVTRSSLHLGTRRENLGDDSLPDLTSHGRPSEQFNHSEFRAAGITDPMSIAGTLMLAAYLTIMKPSMYHAAYTLLRLVRDPHPEIQGPVSKRLRDPALYKSTQVRELGPRLFGETFRSTFELLIRNLTTRSDAEYSSVKQEIWEYVSARSRSQRNLNINGGWRDLLDFLIEEPEGWILYYWARVSIGKAEYASRSDILAPIAAGQEVDLLNLLKRSAKERAHRWAVQYRVRYEEIEREIGALKVKKGKKPMYDYDESSTAELSLKAEVKKYIPPHLRKIANLEVVYDDDRVHTRGLELELYQRMVEYQTKHKVFSLLEVLTYERRIVIGISDAVTTEMLIEFYQARWYSLFRRIEKAKSRGTIFHLGNVALPDHPWGPIVTTYPSTVREILEWMETLNPIGWTIQPSILWTKITESISELWGDISRELRLICDYIDNVEECLGDEQATVLLNRRAQGVMASLAGVDPIIIPVQGYRVPHRLPEKTTQEIVDETQVDTRLPLTSALDKGTASRVVDQQEAAEDQDWVDDDDFDFDSMAGLTSECEKASRDIEITHLIRHLTSREIWIELELGDFPDHLIRNAFCLRDEQSLDDIYLDGLIGVPVLETERAKVKKLWAPWLVGMKARLGIPSKIVEVVEDDM